MIYDLVNLSSQAKNYKNHQIINFLFFIVKRAIVKKKIAILFIFSLIATMPLYANEKPKLSKGQTIYVPAYSHIYSGNSERPFLLTVTLSIRNIDPKYQIEITVADYYATQGTHLKHFLNEAKILKPLESLRYIIPESDKSGGSGANFIVKWKSDKPVNPPIVETVMIGTQTQQGISFTSRGQAIITGMDYKMVAGENKKSKN